MLERRNPKPPIDGKTCERLNWAQGTDDPEKRQEALRGSMYIAKNYYLCGRNILLVDGLYRSGSTLVEATELLYEKVKANNVYVLTMLKTRSCRNK